MGIRKDAFSITDIACVFSEQAVQNLQKWGIQSLETLGLAMAEETGELAQAILHSSMKAASLAGSRKK